MKNLTICTCAPALIVRTIDTWRDSTIRIYSCTVAAVESCACDILDRSKEDHNCRHRSNFARIVDRWCRALRCSGPARNSSGICWYAPDLLWSVDVDRSMTLTPSHLPLCRCRRDLDDVDAMLSNDVRPVPISEPIVRTCLSDRHRSDQIRATYASRFLVRTNRTRRDSDIAIAFDAWSLLDPLCCCASSSPLESIDANWSLPARRQNDEQTPHRIERCPNNRPNATEFDWWPVSTSVHLRLPHRSVLPMFAALPVPESVVESVSSANWPRTWHRSHNRQVGRTNSVAWWRTPHRPK